jgi:flavin-dependent dehydrogenase
LATRDYDVVVAGGGPAGAAAALTLVRAGRSVLMLERSRYDRPRIGESLPPSIRSPLMRLGVWEQFLADAHQPSPGTISVWGDGEPYENQFVFHPHGRGWHLDRARFDRLLAAVAEERGVAVRIDSRVTAVERRPGGWAIELVEQGIASRCRARFLLDASGRQAAFARRHGARRINRDRLVGLSQLLIPIEKQANGDRRTLVEATPEGWWYSAFLPGSQWIAVFMTDADLLPPRSSWPMYWLARVRDAPWTRARLSGCQAAGAPRVSAASSSWLEPAGGPGWLAAGDAALAFDPLSSQGVSRALTSGMAAAEAIDGCLAGRPAAAVEYAQSISAALRRYSVAHAAHYGRERRWPQSAFWRRRIQPSTRITSESGSRRIPL